jgi:hypothetical protein
MRRDEREEAVNRYVIAVAIATVPIIVVALALALRGKGDHSSTVETVPTIPAVEGTSSAATTSTTTAEAPCDPRLFLAVVRQGLTPADERRIARAKVVACRSDYARVNAVPDTSSCPPHCYQGGVMYLHWTGADAPAAPGTSPSRLQRARLPAADDTGRPNLSDALREHRLRARRHRSPLRHPQRPEAGAD